MSASSDVCRCPALEHSLVEASYCLSYYRALQDAGAALVHGSRCLPQLP